MSCHTRNSLWLMGGNSFLFDTHALLPMSECNPMSGTFFLCFPVYEKQAEGALCRALDRCWSTKIKQLISTGLLHPWKELWTALCCTASQINCVDEEECELSPLARGHLYIFSVECRKDIVVFLWMVFWGLWMLHSQALSSVTHSLLIAVFGVFRWKYRQGCGHSL